MNQETKPESPMSPAEAVRLLADAEAKIHQLAMQVRMPAYGQDELREIITEIKHVRESIFNGFPCSSGVCPHQEVATNTPTS